MLKSGTTIIAVIITLFSAAQANMRAPRIIDHAPSSFMTSPQGNMVTVQKENLNIDCDFRRCNVQAVYYITSEKSAELAFAFIMPTYTPVEARVTGTLQPTVVKLDEKHTWISPYWDREKLPLYEAVFSGKILAGANVINIKYNQPLTIMERAYGYFTASRSIELFTYQLGPLKEWHLADDFSLNLSISSLRKRPDRDGGWSMLKSRVIDCMLPGQVLESDSDNLNLTLKIDKNFPETLVCKIGDSDLIGNRE